MGDRIGERFCFVCGKHETLLRNGKYPSWFTPFNIWKMTIYFVEIAETYICITIEGGKIILRQRSYVSYVAGMKHLKKCSNNSKLE